MTIEQLEVAIRFFKTKGAVSLMPFSEGDIYFLDISTKRLGFVDEEGHIYEYVPKTGYQQVILA